MEPGKRTRDPANSAEGRAAVLKTEITVLKDENLSMRMEIGKLQEQLGECLRNQKKLAHDLRLLKAGTVNRQRPLCKAHKAKEPATYDGTRDYSVLENFLWDLRDYFDLTDIPDSKKVSIAVSYLEGYALLWWRFRKVFGDVEPCENWEQMQQIMRARFCPANAGFRARDKLKELKHTDSIGEYIRAFDKLMFEIRDMNEADKLYWFENGLQPWAQDELRWRNADTLDKAIKAAHVLEDLGFDRSVKKGLHQAERNGSESQGPCKFQRTGKGSSQLKRTCFVCGSESHMRKECPERADLTP